MAPPRSHMANSLKLLENWTEDLADAVIRLRGLLDDLGEVQQEVSGAAALAHQFMLLAAIDEVFLSQLFRQLDPAMVIAALEHSDARTRRTFLEAADHLRDRFT